MTDPADKDTTQSQPKDLVDLHDDPRLSDQGSIYSGNPGHDEGGAHEGTIYDDDAHGDDGDAGSIYAG
jgi:hypothetical protein